MDQKLRNTFLIAVLLTGIMFVVELISSIYARSYSLMSDSGHIFLDVASLGLLFYACCVQAEPARAGVKDTEIKTKGAIASLISATVLACFLLFVVVPGAIYRLWNITLQINGINTINVSVVSIMAIIGLLINIIVYFMIKQSVKQCVGNNKLVMQAALLHIKADLWMSLIAIIAAGLTWFTGSQIWDPVLSLVFVYVLIEPIFELVRDSILVLNPKKVE